MSPLSFFLFFLLSDGVSPQPQPLFPNQCNERCGHLQLPFPFHLNSSCGPPINSFHLSCHLNSLYLTLGPTDLRIISFLPSGSLLLDYSPNSISSSLSSPCNRWYSDVNHIFDRSPFFAVTADNILRLYDCEDSSICKTGCERIDGRCEGNGGGCCYPLSDGSVWKSGDGFGVFSEFGCRGFSSWVGARSISSSSQTERGIEMEWAVPRGYGNGTDCAEGAVAVNATAVRGGVRCACGGRLVGDGFAGGAGCFKSCGNYGNTAYGGDCWKGRLCRKKVAVLVGLLVSLFFLATATACYFLLRRPKNTNRWVPDQTCLPKILGKACRTRLFTYQELNKATKGFDQDQKLIDVADGTVHPGVLDDGSPVAVQRVRCETQQNLRQVLNRVELLSQISHKNIARIIGCCVRSGYTLLLVHEFFPNGTLKELLQPDRGNAAALSWYRRINIATEVASALAHLQSEISPPINPYDLKSSDIFIDSDYSIKIAGFKLLNSGVSLDSDVVHNFGLILLELIMGSERDGLQKLVLDKIKEGRFHEIVDPCLRFGEQLPVQCDQIERLAGFAVHFLSRKGLSMVGVAKEFIHIVNDSTDSGSLSEPVLEVTFSNSSLLQMISVSPDSINVA